MSKKDKLMQKFLNTKRNLFWSDLVAVLIVLGFRKIEAEGSRVDFVKGNLVINLHKPHPSKEVKIYALKQVKDKLKEWGEI